MRSNNSTFDKKTDVINYPFRKIYIKSLYFIKLMKSRQVNLKRQNVSFFELKQTFRFTCLRTNLTMQFSSEVLRQ